MLQYSTESSKASGIVFAEDSRAIDRLASPRIQAVILKEKRELEWEALLAAGVMNGRFRFPRISHQARILSLPNVLERLLPEDGLDFETRLALIDDIVSMADALGRLTRSLSVTLRILAEPPTETCGFHVDTVPPGLPPFGLLKVYNGAPTRYVLSRDVVDMTTFYGFLSKRERLSAQWRSARSRGETAEAERCRGAMLELDHALSFLKAGARVYEVPSGSMVAFRHLDVREHWTPHPPDRAWLHCSPMSGAPRLVVNITPAKAGPALRG
jgi:Protein of unknown function (DUF1826)